MAKVQWEDENVGNRKNHLKFKVNAWTRFNIIDLEAEHDKIHYDRGYQMCTKHGSKKEYKCGKCGGNLSVSQDINNPGVVCSGCNILGGPKVAVCRWCDQYHKEPEDRFAANVIVYKTDEMGQPLGPMNDKSFYVTWWPFGSDKWNVIRMAKRTMGDLRKHDFMFFCQEEKYQRGTLQAMPEAWWLADPNFSKIVAAAFKENAEPNLAAKIARYVPYDQQLAHIANQPSPQGRGQQQQGRGQQGMGGMPMGGGMSSFDPTAVASRVGASAPAGMPLFNQPSPPQQDTALDSLLAGAPSTPIPITPAPTLQPDPIPASPTNSQTAGAPDLDEMLANMNR